MYVCNVCMYAFNARCVFDVCIYVMHVWMDGCMIYIYVCWCCMSCVMYACMYIMYVCHVRLYVRNVCMYACDVCNAMYVCMHVCMHVLVCMYVCKSWNAMHVCNVSSACV